MGDFVIYQKDKLDKNAHDSVLKTLDAQGSKKPKIIEHDSYKVLLFKKTISQIENYFENERGDFCASSGTFYYNGNSSLSALEMYLEDFDPYKLSPKGFMGIFTLIIKKNGRLYLITDPMGASRVFHNSTMTFWSSSFLAIAKNLPGHTIDPQGVYEYCFQETNYGESTPFHEVKMADSFMIFEFETNGIKKIPRSLPVSFEVSNDKYDDLIEEHSSLLKQQMANIANIHGNNIATALSGGYDSRLMLSLALNSSIKPKVYVYGADNSPDVMIAKQIAKGENFQLNHINKAKHPRPDLEQYRQVVQDTFYALDGYPNESIFDFGANMETRRERAKGMTLVLNGGGGEIYRNFFYLPDGSYTVENLLDVFYSRYTLDIVSDRFSEYIYRDNLKRKIKKALNLRTEEITRTQLEYAYPAFRLRYWTSKDNSNNTRLGQFLTPFICYETIMAALRLPLKYKTHGRFQGDLINHINPELARYTSDYGYAFNETIPFLKKIKNNMTIYRPVWLRKNSYAIQHRLKKLKKHDAISDQYLKAVLPHGAPYMSQFFNITQIKDTALLGRIFTLEYLFKHIGV